MNAAGTERRVRYPKFEVSANYELLTSIETVAKWNEIKMKPGMRFGGVGLIRVEDGNDLVYVFVSGNDLVSRMCPVHKTAMSIERVLRDTAHNIARSVYYYCYRTDYRNGRRIECGENIYPEFQNDQLQVLMADADVTKRPRVVVLT